MDSIITLRKYISKQKTFVVPDYQRGYIWGKRKSNLKDLDSVSYILNTIFSKLRNREPIFLQGVTVTENSDSIVLIDGQQRTTFLYILLRMLGYAGEMNIRYDVREESGRFLEKLTAEVNCEDKADDEFQDIYYFKKTARLIKERIKEGEVNNTELTEYLLDNIRFLYINIPENQAKKVFTMMNGNRAKMLEPDIIKAELLRLVSHPTSESQTDEWDLNMLRGRYAREWDRWVHWWNREDVRRMYNTDNLLGWLLVAIMPGLCESPKQVTFESFCKEILKDSRTTKDAKDTFYRLRQTQKRFEDTFNNAIRHNMVGAILRINPTPVKFVKYYFSGQQVGDDALKKHYLCSFLRMTHDNIVGQKFDENFIEHYNITLDSLKKPLIYENNQSGCKEAAFHLLLRRNIDEDNRQNNGLGRRFDFAIWDNGLRSLEHIYPKSQVYHKDKTSGEYRDGNNAPCSPSEKMLNREDIEQVDIEDKFPLIGENEKPDNPLKATEHCIGNLVLLYKDDNSSLNNSDFQKKKEMFLGGGDDVCRKEIFKSRHLLHTIYHFAESEWGAEEIRKYFRSTLEEYSNMYKPIIETLSKDDEE